MNKNLRNFVLFLAFVAIIGVIYYITSSGILDSEKIETFVESYGMWGPVIFGLIYVIISSLGISAAALTILAGVLFGIWLGLIVVVVSATIAAGITFFIGRYFMHLLPQRKKDSKKLFNKLVKMVEDNAKQNGFLAVCILRLSFLPYIPLSYACGFVRNLKFSSYIMATFLTNIVGSFVFIYFGASLTQSLPFFLSGVVLLILFIYLVRRFNKKKK